MATRAQGGGQYTDNTPSHSTPSFTVSAGSLISIRLSAFTTTPTFASGDCTKTAGTATIGAVTLDRTQADGNEQVGAWSCIVTASGTLTMSVATSAGVYGAISYDEFPGSWDAARVEAANSAPFTTSTTPSSGNVTSAAGGVLVGAIAVDTSANITFTPGGSGWTNTFAGGDGTAHAVGCGSYKLLGSGATEAASWTLSGGAIVTSAALVVAYKEAAGGGGPTITGTSSATPARGAAFTITGSGFGATQGTKSVKVGGTTQAGITSWADGSIVVTALDEGANQYGVAVNVEIWDAGSLVSNSFALTSLQPAADYVFFNSGTPNTTSAFALEATPAIASGDQVEGQSLGGAVTYYTDDTFSCLASVTTFQFRVWSSGGGWGSWATQTVTAFVLTGTGPRVAPILGGGPVGSGSAEAVKLAQVSSSSSWAAAGAAQPGGNASLSTSVAVQATGAAQPSGSAALLSTAAIVPVGTASPFGSASLVSPAALVANGVALPGGAALLSTAVVIAAAGAAVPSGTAVLALSLTLAAAGAAQPSGSAALGTSVALGGSGAAQPSGTAALGTSAVLAAAGAARPQGAAGLAASAALVAAASAQPAGSATLGTSVAIAAAGSAQPVGQAALGTSVALAAAGQALPAGSASFAPAGAVLSAAGAARPAGSAALATSVALSGTGSAQPAGLAALSTSVALVAAGQAAPGGTASLAAASAVLVAAGVARPAGAGTLVASVALSASGAASPQGSAVLQVAAAWIAAGAARPAGSAALNAAAALGAAGAAQPAGFAFLSTAELRAALASVNGVWTELASPAPGDQLLYLTPSGLIEPKSSPSTGDRPLTRSPSGVLEAGTPA